MKLFSMSFFVSPDDGGISLKSILQVAQLVRQGVNPCLPNSKHHHDILLPQGVMSSVCKYISKSKVKPMGIVSGWKGLLSEEFLRQKQSM